jgi:hypothetical protein
MSRDFTIFTIDRPKDEYIFRLIRGGQSAVAWWEHDARLEIQRRSQKEVDIAQRTIPKDCLLTGSCQVGKYDW